MSQVKFLGEILRWKHDVDIVLQVSWQLLSQTKTARQFLSLCWPTPTQRCVAWAFVHPPPSWLHEWEFWVCQLEVSVPLSLSTALVVAVQHYVSVLTTTGSMPMCSRHCCTSPIYSSCTLERTTCSTSPARRLPRTSTASSCTSCVCAVVVSQLFWMPKYKDKYEQITIANTAIEEHLQQIQARPLASQNTVHIQYLCHLFGIWGQNRLSLFLWDRTHLNQHRLRKYFYSIRTSASAHLRELMSQWWEQLSVATVCLQVALLTTSKRTRWHTRNSSVNMVLAAASCLWQHTHTEPHTLNNFGLTVSTYCWLSSRGKSAIHPYTWHTAPQLFLRIKCFHTYNWQ